MRTTLTLDEDVAVRIDRLRRERETSLKEIANEGLRRGLAEMPRLGERKPFRTKTFDVGEILVPDLDNIAEVLAYAEGDDFKQMADQDR